MNKKRDKKRTGPSPGMVSSEEGSNDKFDQLIRWHLRFGWWSLLVFLTLGIVLESMHGFKVQWYVGENNTTRRLMWTLAHAHGTLLSLIHLAYAASRPMLGQTDHRFEVVRSRCLSLSTVLIPLGFLVGGLTVYDGDPGLGILLVPVGALLLFAGVLLTAISV